MSAPNQPRSVPPPIPPLASRRPLLPPPSWKCGAKSPWLRRVKIWITPPMASAPYRLDCGPRTISTRSICASGRSWYIARPRSALLMRTPSTSTTVAGVGAAQEQRALLAQAAGIGQADAGAAAQQFLQRGGLAGSICARSITWAGAMLSCRAIGVRVAVTRIWSSAVVSWRPGPARAGRPARPGTTFGTAASWGTQVPRTPAWRRGGAAKAGTRRCRSARHGHPAPCPPHRDLRLPGRSPGLPPGGASRPGAFPCLRHSGSVARN